MLQRLLRALRDLIALLWSAVAPAAPAVTTADAASQEDADMWPLLLPVGPNVAQLATGADTLRWLVRAWAMDAAALKALLGDFPEGGGGQAIIMRVVQSSGRALLAWIAHCGGLTRAIAAVLYADETGTAPVDLRSYPIGHVVRARSLASNITQVSSIFYPPLADALEYDRAILSLCSPQDYTLPAMGDNSYDSGFGDSGTEFDTTTDN